MHRRARSRSPHAPAGARALGPTAALLGALTMAAACSAPPAEAPRDAGPSSRIETEQGALGDRPTAGPAVSDARGAVDGTVPADGLELAEALERDAPGGRASTTVPATGPPVGAASRGLSIGGGTAHELGLRLEEARQREASSEPAAGARPSSGVSGGVTGLALRNRRISDLPMRDQEAIRVGSRRSVEAVARVGGALSAAGPATPVAEDGERSLDLALIDYDEVWVVARRDRRGSLPPPGERAEAGLRARSGEGEDLPFPLRRTAVDAQVDGFVASVLVRQSYHNPYDEKIEAVYVFPLPEDAAVSEFAMTIGDRRIRGIIREREEAERVYQEARRQGHVASLLTQERPNVFTERVANIEPGRDVDIELRYFGALPYHDGSYEFTFPMVVGPRFNPAGTTDGVGAVARGATGSSGQSTEVQYLAPGEDTGHRLDLTVSIDAGVSLEEVASPTHPIDVQWLGTGRRRVTLADGEALPNADFVLRYRVAGEAVKAGLLHDRERDGGTFSLILQPPAELVDYQRAPMEFIFVLDCSGSMRGEPLAIAKRAVRHVLEDLTPDDTFQLIRFSSDASQLGGEPVPATPANVAQGLRYLESLKGSGGTAMIRGIEAALDFPHDPRRLRLVTFLTDGFIGNERQILAAVHQRLGSARIFSFGVGSSPNRYLLDRMAALGRGAVAWVGPNAMASEEEVHDFLERIAHPGLTDVTVDWHGARVRDVYPSRLPDLFHGRPVVLTGRFDGDPPRHVTVSGRAAGEPVTIEVALDPRGGDTRPGLAKVWARARIRSLARRELESGRPGTYREEILAVALQHGLVSEHTAFVAVDGESRTGGDHGVTVAVPVPVPAGVRYDTTVGRGG